MKKRRALLHFVFGLSVAIGAAALACTTADLTPQDTSHCSVMNPCPCEQDPTQLTCKGFNDRPEGGVVAPFDSGSLPDGNEGGQTDANVADSDVEASDDAGDGGDGGD